MECNGCLVLRGNAAQPTRESPILLSSRKDIAALVHSTCGSLQADLSALLSRLTRSGPDR